VRRSLLVQLLVLALSGSVPGRSATADWPQWRGPTRDGKIAVGSRAPNSLPADPNVLWRLPVGEGLASPIVAGGKVFAIDNAEGEETIHALDAGSGREVWRAVVEKSFQDEQGPAGPRCTPLTDGEWLYVQSCRGELQCRAVDDGRLRWRRHYQREFGSVLLGEDSKVPGAAEHGYTASPLLVRNQLIACVGGTNGAGIVSFDRHTGDVRWTSQNDLAAYAAPILATLAGHEQLVCFTVEGVIGLAPDTGRLLWRVPLRTAYGRNVATPVTVRDWVIVGSYQAGMVGIRVTSNASGLQAAAQWTNKAAAMNFSSPVAVGDHVYSLGPKRNLICVDALSGKIAWSKEGLWTSSPDAAYGAFLVVGENLLIWTDSGEAILASATQSAYRELGRMQCCGRNWCSPALVDQRLYVRDGLHGAGKLLCLDLAPRASSTAGDAGRQRP
jgi:outer membrane protein assembly factor BamB